MVKIFAVNNETGRSYSWQMSRVPCVGECISIPNFGNIVRVKSVCHNVDVKSWDVQANVVVE